MTLIEQLKQIPDNRKAKGKRHELWLVLVLIILGYLCGYRGYRPLAQFTALLNAAEFLSTIQAHWHIENRLHWVRDVTLQEDHPPAQGGNAPMVWALLNCWLISIVRNLNHRTLPDGLRAIANQVGLLFRMLTEGFSSA